MNDRNTNKNCRERRRMRTCDFPNRWEDGRRGMDWRDDRRDDRWNDRRDDRWDDRWSGRRGMDWRDDRRDDRWDDRRDDRWDGIRRGMDWRDDRRDERWNDRRDDRWDDRRDGGCCSMNQTGEYRDEQQGAPENEREREGDKRHQMDAEQIAQEKEINGWNQYEGEEEEEETQMPEQITIPDRIPASDRQQTQAARQMMDSGQPMPSGQMMDSGRSMDSGQPMMQPYFQRPDFSQILEEQREAERDLRMLQSMYPQIAKMLLPLIEEECDKMEFEGSTMYDVYPDQTTIQLIVDRIFEQMRDQLPEEEAEQPDEMLSMQFQGNRRDRRRRNQPRDLIRILLLNEMHHRRCRHGRCRRRW